MRWIYFLILVLVAVVLQTTVAPALWFRAWGGYVGPELLAAVSVFVALHTRSAADAALAGWALGFALDLTLSGGGMGLLSLLYAAGAAGVFHVRDAFFAGRPMTQAILGLLFCLFVYELWTAYDVLTVPDRGQGWWPQAARAGGLAVYTAAVTPLVCAALKRVRRLLIVLPAGRQRR